jgi:beta-phosphoglucomutase-like phosphatase (HAD superfamily)
MGLATHFSVVLAAEDVPTSKPSPEGYLMAAKELKVASRDCVVFEDSTAGIGAGRAAGCKVVAVEVGNYAKQDQSAAHRVISTLEEVTLDLFAELFA